MKAGRICNTFPKMGDVWIPTKNHFEQKLSTSFIDLNFTENPFIVHFNHRALSTITLGVLIGNLI